VQFYHEDGSLDVRLSTYIDYFTRLGFNEIDGKELQERVLKIAIYSDNNNDFKHVSRQLQDNGKWVSKIGDWEDIVHDSPEALLGKSYGTKLVILAKTQ
jgi:hypothetical protein